MTGAGPLVVGASSSPTCGLRDYAAALDPWLEPSETVWWERDSRWSARETRRSARRFAGEIAAALARRPRAVLWNYAVFDYGRRTAWDLQGTPVHTAGVARRLRASRVPVITVVHEAAYSFREPGWQRKALALTHRAALVGVTGASHGLVVSTEDRERWIAGRRWLGSRPIARIPVCSTLPRATPVESSSEVAVLGFGADDARAATVTGAIRRLRDRGVDTRVRLIGQPGETGRAADRWRRAAGDAGVAGALSFGGVASPGELARDLASAPLVLFPNAAGPVAGKTTIASALAQGRPVVAIDGPQRWDGFDGPVALVKPTAAGLADRLESLLRDSAARDRLAAAGASLHERELSPEVTARRLLAFAVEVAA